MFITARSKLCLLPLMTCLGAGAWACNQSKAPAAASSSEPVSAPGAPQAASNDVAAKANQGNGTVSAAGTTFDPPVEKSTLAAGTWICDMGTVHYARSAKGDGKCPECGMNLTQLGTSTEGQAGSHAH